MLSRLVDRAGASAVEVLVVATVVSLVVAAAVAFQHGAVASWRLGSGEARARDAVRSAVERLAPELREARSIVDAGEGFIEFEDREGTGVRWCLDGETLVRSEDGGPVTLVCRGIAAFTSSEDPSVGVVTIELESVTVYGRGFPLSFKVKPRNR